jgi:hypothetical protein
MVAAHSFARLLRTFVLLPLAVPFAACGSDDGNGAPAVSASAVPTYEKFRQQAASISCASVTPCCSSYGREINDKCAEDALDAGKGNLFIGIDTRGNYSPEGAAACLSAYAANAKTVSCSPSADTTPKGYAPNPCNGVYRSPNFGTRGLTEACTLDGDCIPAGNNALTTCSVGSDGGGSGQATCRARVTALEGEGCGTGAGPDAGKTFECLSNLECKDFVCVRLPSPGEPCSEGRCTTGAQCLPSGSGKSVCAARGKEGGACDTGVSCLDGLYCDGVVCKAPGKVGDACRGGGGPVGPVGPGSGTCASGTYCDGVVCKAYAKLDEYCETDASCASGNCTSKLRCGPASPSTPGSIDPYAPYCQLAPRPSALAPRRGSLGAVSCLPLSSRFRVMLRDHGTDEGLLRRGLARRRR